MITLPPMLPFRWRMQLAAAPSPLPLGGLSPRTTLRGEGGRPTTLSAPPVGEGGGARLSLPQAPGANHSLPSPPWRAQPAGPLHFHYLWTGPLVPSRKVAEPHLLPSLALVVWGEGGWGLGCKGTPN